MIYFRFQVKPGDEKLNVNEIRTSLGLSKSEFAWLLGCTYRSVHHWEKTESLPARGFLRDLLTVISKLSNPHLDLIAALVWLSGCRDDGERIICWRTILIGDFKDETIPKSLATFVEEMRTVGWFRPMSIQPGTYLLV